MKARVIVASTRAATGIYEDTGGPILKRGLEEIGCEVDEVVVVADGEPVRQALVAALDSKPDVIVTTGGTGLTPRCTLQRGSRLTLPSGHSLVSQLATAEDTYSSRSARSARTHVRRSTS